MRPAVERDDARLANHLVTKHHHAECLHDLVTVVVDGRQNRSESPARDAAVVETAVKVAVGFPPLESLTTHARLHLLVGLTLLSFCRQGRLAPVGRIDDE